MTRAFFLFLFAFQLIRAQTLPRSLPGSPAQNFKVSVGADYETLLKNTPRNYPNLDLNKEYQLYELIDIAEEQNPATRIAWNRLRSQLAEVGSAKSPYYPWFNVTVPLLQDRSLVIFPIALLPVLGADSTRSDTTTFNPVLRLRYLLLDFGARRGQLDAARANAFSAGIGLNDAHEQIAIAVTSSYYNVLTAKGLVESAQATLKDAEISQRSVEERLSHGTATVPNLLNAKAQREQAVYSLENEQGREDIAASSLAQNVGVNPTAHLKIKNMTDAPPRSELEESVESVIDRALLHRPDLLEQLAAIRAADAQIKEARSALYPTATLDAQVGYDSIRTDTNVGPGPYIHQGNWRGEITLNWTIFDAKRRQYRIVEAQAAKRIAEQRLSSLRDVATREVWSAYIAAKVAFRRLDTSTVLLSATQTSYDAALASFNTGLSTYVDVIAAQQALAQARSEKVQANAEVLTDLAQLAYRAGDLLGSRFLKANRNGQ